MNTYTNEDDIKDIWMIWMKFTQMTKTLIMVADDSKV